MVCIQTRGKGKGGGRGEKGEGGRHGEGGRGRGADGLCTPPSHSGKASQHDVPTLTGSGLEKQGVRLAFQFFLEGRGGRGVWLDGWGGGGREEGEGGGGVGFPFEEGKHPGDQGGYGIHTAQ